MRSVFFIWNCLNSLHIDSDVREGPLPSPSARLSSFLQSVLCTICSHYRAHHQSRLWTWKPNPNLIRLLVTVARQVSSFVDSPLVYDRDHGHLNPYQRLSLQLHPFLPKDVDAPKTNRIIKKLEINTYGNDWENSLFLGTAEVTNEGRMREHENTKLLREIIYTARHDLFFSLSPSVEQKREKRSLHAPNYYDVRLHACKPSFQLGNLAGRGLCNCSRRWWWEKRERGLGLGPGMTTMDGLMMQPSLVRTTIDGSCREIMGLCDNNYTSK